MDRLHLTDPFRLKFNRPLYAGPMASFDPTRDILDTSALAPYLYGPWSPAECDADWPAMKRVMVRWHGGKAYLARAIIDVLAVAHDCYTEVFGGGASVLLRKPPSPVEVLNDLDDDIVGLYRVLRDVRLSARLRDALRLTPYARAEFYAAHETAPGDDAVERARKTIVRQSMGFASQSARLNHLTVGFRSNSDIDHAPVRDWIGYPAFFAKVSWRLSGVMIENRPAIQILRDHDRSTTVHYVDPPYVLDTRSDARKGYNAEMTDADHAELLEVLLGLHGMVCLSGYASPLYDGRLAGWERRELGTRDMAGQDRVEVLWLNPALAAAQDSMRPPKARRRVALKGAEPVATQARLF